MRKRIKHKQLSRNTHQRKALFKNLMVALIENEEIKTTNAKAKAVRGLFEKIVTKGKSGSLHTRRLIHSMLQNKEATKKLVDDISKRYKDTKGGYTRIQKIGNRRGDNAPMVTLSLTKKKIEEEKGKKVSKKKTAKKILKKSPKTKAQKPKSTKKPALSGIKAKISRPQKKV